MIFDGIMDSTFYQELLRDNLVPFIKENYPNGHRMWQDNDPKHTSRASVAFYEEQGLNWWKTPAQSPVIFILSFRHT